MIPAPDAAALYTPIRAEFIGGRWLRLLESVSWTGPYPATLPAGFVSDGGTIPAAAWPFVGHPLSASMLICYLLHDAELQARIPWDDARQRLDARAKAVGIADARRVAIVAAVGLKGLWNRITGQ